MKQKVFSHQELHAKWTKDPEYQHEYAMLETEFQIANQMIAARAKRKISQEELAKRANTGQAVISRIENMNANPTVPLLQKIARALGTKFQITIQ